MHHTKNLERDFILQLALTMPKDWLDVAKDPGPAGVYASKWYVFYVPLI